MLIRKEDGEVLSRHMELGDAKAEAGRRIERGESRPAIRTTHEWLTVDQLSTLHPSSQSKA
jgi:hypothetical protein